MPLRQISTTPEQPLPPREGHGIPYAFAVRLERAAVHPMTTYAAFVHCPWCGEEERVEHMTSTTGCPRIGRRYTVAIPAGTPVFA